MYVANSSIKFGIVRFKLNARSWWMRTGKRRTGAHLFILRLSPHYARARFIISSGLDGEQLRLAPNKFLQCWLSLVFLPHWTLPIFYPANILGSNLVSFELKFDQFRVELVAQESFKTLLFSDTGKRHERALGNVCPTLIRFDKCLWCILMPSLWCNNLGRQNQFRRIKCYSELFNTLGSSLLRTLNNCRISSGYK